MSDNLQRRDFLKLSTASLSEMSVAGRSKPVDFPDFTRGKWETAPVLDFN